MLTPSQVCWEILHPDDPVLPQVRDLYLSTQKEEEQIPWEWIERSIARRAAGHRGRWQPHLLVSSEVTESKIVHPQGFILGGYMSDFGGYISYLGVDSRNRRRGQGRILFESMFEILRQDAVREGFSLPFVVWESGQPEWDAPETDWQIWHARMKLFERVGGYWLKGLDFLSPNYLAEEEFLEAEPIVLQLFLRPIEAPLVSFDPTRLKSIAMGLQQRIYQLAEDDPLVVGTFPEGSSPKLVSPLQALRQRERSLL